jgi:hypothetical protein
MNVATDIIHLSGAASLVPGLSVAFKLAIMIIQTVQVCRLDTYVSSTKFFHNSQISKRNTARLQYLAHLVAESLISIAENMEGKWDDAPVGLKIKLDEFEA